MTVHDIAGSLPIAIGIFLCLKMSGGATYQPPPHGGPGGDMGLGHTFKKAVHSLMPSHSHDDDNEGEK